jgi:stage III sporulation protein AD
MDRFWQIIAGVLLTVVLGMLLSKSSKDMTLVLTMVVCVMVLTAAFAYLQPVMSFIHRLTEMTKLNTDLLAVILKTVGIGIVGELATLICTDAGNTALAKTVQILTTAMILWLSIPLFESLLDLVQAILGEL